MKHHRSFTDYFLTTNSRGLKRNVISNVKNVRILEKDRKSLQIPKYCLASIDHLNSKSIFNQQSYYESLKWQNSDSYCKVKQYNNIRIENEEIEEIYPIISK